MYRLLVKQRFTLVSFVLLRKSPLGISVTVMQLLKQEMTSVRLMQFLNKLAGMRCNFQQLSNKLLKEVCSIQFSKMFSGTSIMRSEPLKASSSTVLKGLVLPSGIMTLSM